MATNAEQKKQNPHSLIQEMSSKGVADIRDNRGMVSGEVAHQGDIYVVKVDKLADLEKILNEEIVRAESGKGVRANTKFSNAKFEETKDRQLAPGTTVGSRHCVEGEKVKLSVTNREAWPLLGPVIEAKDEWRLTHPEHADHIMPAGTFVSVFQRMFDPEADREAKRRVLD